MSKPAKKRAVAVKQFKPGWWGITDGKLWWFYAFSTEELAKARLRFFDNQEAIRVNVSLPEPVGLSAISPGATK